MITLLVVSSDDPFGEHLRKSLEGSGRFSVLITGNTQTAVEYVRENAIPLAFLDDGLSSATLTELGSMLRQANPDIRFVIVSAEAGWHPALEELTPIKYLAKPFASPDLMEMMDDLFGKLHSTPVTSAPQPEADYPWLVDVTRAAQHLTRLTLETSAQAALITRSDELWSYAGQLPQEAARELADAVARYWDSQKERDLVRFIRLNATDADHMLFATRLTNSMVLALIFDAETPFSIIRQQANQLVRSLWVSPSEKAAAEALGMAEDEEEEAPQASISAILTDIPSPNPQAPAIQERPAWKETSPVVPISFGKSLRFTRDIQPRSDISDTPEVISPSTDLERTQKVPTVQRKDRSLKADGDDSLTRPARPPEITTRRIIFEPITPAVYNLDYVYMLIPRLPNHYLTGDLTDSLSEWIPQLCVAFGWRLEHIAIRPEYLLLVANVPPSTSPAHVVRQLRMHSSQRIMEDFPRLQRENPSGDFWAPGYLLMGGSQPPASHILRDYISQVRQQQGFIP